LTAVRKGLYVVFMKKFVIGLAVAALGCGSKQAEEPPAGAGPAKAEVGKPAEAPRPPPQIECDKAIPKDVIARHLPNATTEWGAPFDNGEGSFITSCRFIEDGVKGRTIVRYKCGPTFANLDRYLGAVEPQIKADDGSAFKFGRIEGIGRGAFRDKTSIAALHREMPCIVEVDEMGDRVPPDWTALLKDLEAALGPAAAK
jgi:hypothetical protein